MSNSSKKRLSDFILVYEADNSKRVIMFRENDDKETQPLHNCASVNKSQIFEKTRLRAGTSFVTQHES